MKVLIVHAHPEPQSFNGALTRRAVEVLTAAGHEVQVSDLYAMNFNPVSDRRNFTTVKNAGFYHPQTEELHATENHGFAPDLEAEMQKVEWCDTLIFQFPLWWFGVPAILKGWVDRVFAMGRAYGAGRMYDTGIFKGKRAIASLTTGGPEEVYVEGGFTGDINVLLKPILRGMFAFTGFTVLPPFIAYAAARVSDAERAAYLDAWAERLNTIETTEPMQL